MLSLSVPSIVKMLLLNASPSTGTARPVPLYVALFDCTQSMFGSVFLFNSGATRKLEHNSHLIVKLKRSWLVFILGARHLLHSSY